MTKKTKKSHAQEAENPRLYDAVQQGIHEIGQCLDVETLTDEAYINSANHGFWSDADLKAIVSSVPEDQPRRTEVILMKLALVHAEISEAVEECRRGDYENRIEHGKPEGFYVELADAIIRICDLVGAMGGQLDLEAALYAKLSYNRSRPHKHGKLA